jgi:glycosyltransferase involved in cell wall biosynthesis
MTKVANPPLVSICTPCYNQAHFLQTLFDSLLDQTYANIQFIFLDDCSSDDSWSVAETYSEKLKQKFSLVHMIRNEANLGALRNLQKAFTLARGEFISYLEADDFYLTEKVERNVHFLNEHSDYGAVHSDYVRLYPDGTKVPSFARHYYATGAFGPITSGWIHDRLLAENFVCAPTLMVRRELFFRTFLFEEFARRNYKMGDYPALLILSQLAAIGFIDEPLACYRQLDFSMSHSLNPTEKKEFREATNLIRRDARLGRLSPLLVESGQGSAG